MIQLSRNTLQSLNSLRNTKKAQEAYLSTEADLGKSNAPVDAEAYQRLTDKAKSLSFFVLVTFDQNELVTGFYSYTNADVPLPLFSFSVWMDSRQMESQREFFALMFVALTHNMERHEHYQKFLGGIMEG